MWIKKLGLELKDINTVKNIISDVSGVLSEFKTPDKKKIYQLLRLLLNSLITALKCEKKINKIIHY